MEDARLPTASDNGVEPCNEGVVKVVRELEAADARKLEAAAVCPDGTNGSAGGRE